MQHVQARAHVCAHAHTQSPEIIISIHLSRNPFTEHWKKWHFFLILPKDYSEVEILNLLIWHRQMRKVKSFQMPLLKYFFPQDQSLWSDFLQVSLPQDCRKPVLPTLSSLATLILGMGGSMFEEYFCNLNFFLIFPQSVLENQVSVKPSDPIGPA